MSVFRETDAPASAEPNNPARHITPTRLRSERGWTDGMIRRYLGGPDKTATNPHYRCAPEMKLYLVSRVEAAESRAEVRADLDKAASRRPARRAAAKRAAETKERQADEEAEKWLANTKIRWRWPPVDKIKSWAIRHYNEHTREYNCYRAMIGRSYSMNPRLADSDSDSLFLDRITRNFLRHGCSNYDQILEDARLALSKQAAEEVYWLLRTQVDGEIDRFLGSLPRAQRT